MFLVPTYVAQSSIDGFGVFTSVDIPKSAIVWRFDPAFDRTYSADEISAFPESVREFIAKCGFLDKRKNRYFLGGDYDIFTNHSDSPALIEDENDVQGKTDMLSTPRLVAARDIAANEELTQNYFEYDDTVDADVKLRNAINA